ncbi:hypothetical protein B0H10DRAFT_2302083 [Mycena sp. CBHHK59/15]|nr:hypothetical protein B0H10DRAFT_2302083 [Mycena sp. CBHHK59/15]
MITVLQLLNNLSAQSLYVQQGNVVPEIQLIDVWLGDGRTIMCWVLPKSLCKRKLKAKDAARLEIFKIAAEIVDQTPKCWAAVDGRLPTFLRGQTEVSPELAHLQIDSQRSTLINPIREPEARR